MSATRIHWWGSRTRVPAESTKYRVCTRPSSVADDACTAGSASSRADSSARIGSHVARSSSRTPWGPRSTTAGSGAKSGDGSSSATFTAVLATTRCQVSRALATSLLVAFQTAIRSASGSGSSGSDCPTCQSSPET